MANLRTRRRSASRFARAVRLKRRQDLETQTSSQRDASTNTDSRLSSSQTGSADASNIARNSRETSSAPSIRQSARLRQQRREQQYSALQTAVQRDRSRVFRLSEQLAATSTRRVNLRSSVNIANEPVNSLDIQALQRDLMEQRAQLARQHAILVEHQRINSRLRRRVNYQERVELRVSPA